jgi:hypothetical protein
VHPVCNLQSWARTHAVLAIVEKQNKNPILSDYIKANIKKKNYAELN